MNKMIAFITGATAGIGKATAEVFAKNGYNLIITGRRKERLEEFSTYLKATYKTEVLFLN
ncbi:MAG: SDR family NAD(P)-dependent oxidoreductase, partial [Bacteroidetes bacterium]|nr:SDR family NAD(P)-dependent oxidoreductase [Bacteroidota bacterium]